MSASSQLMQRTTASIFQVHWDLAPYLRRQLLVVPVWATELVLAMVLALALVLVSVFALVLAPTLERVLLVPALLESEPQRLLESRAPLPISPRPYELPMLADCSTSHLD
jgi:hypothetical protein